MEDQQKPKGGRGERNKRVNNQNATPKKKGGGAPPVAYQPKEEPKELPTGPMLEYFDSHCHLDLILERHNIPTDLEAFKKFFELNMSNEAAEQLVGRNNKKKSEQKDSIDLYSLKGRLQFGGCLQVACFLPGFDATMEFIKIDCVYGSYGNSPCSWICCM